MFTGIIQRCGTVAAIETMDHGRTICVAAGDWPPDRQPGESIAVNGCCLTLVDGPGSDLRFDVVHETLAVTTLETLDADSVVNLERSVTPTTLLGGHVVQGHVDGVGTVERLDTGDGEYRLTIVPPVPLLPYIVMKGSITIDGVSLTIAGLAADSFEVALVPTTLEVTTLGRLRAGDPVNLETDYLVKALARLTEFRD